MMNEKRAGKAVSEAQPSELAGPANDPKGGAQDAGGADRMGGEGEVDPSTPYPGAE